MNAAVLLAEPEPSTREFLQRHLADDGFDVLAAEPERVFTKEQLLREVWGYLSLGRTRTLDSHASRLRRKLRQAGAGPCVVNIWGVANIGLNLGRYAESVPTQCPNTKKGFTD